MNTQKERHPKALYLLFFTEMWERFSYYGMRALLTLYLVSETINGGLGWSSKEAGGLYGTYTMLVYVTPLLGGYLADKFLGYRLSVIIGGLLMALGHGSLAFESMPFFFTGLGLLIIGNGFFKPNISSMVGQLYPDNSKLKDSGYTIFYMGINVGAFLGTIVCGWLGESIGWHWGFGAAGIGMVAGLITFYFGQGMLGEIGKKPTKKNVLHSEDDLGLPKKGITKVQGQQLLVLGVFSLFSILFWMAFEQAGSSMNIFAKRYSDQYTGNLISVNEFYGADTKQDSLLLVKTRALLASKKYSDSTDAYAAKEVRATSVLFYRLTSKSSSNPEVLGLCLSDRYDKNGLDNVLKRMPEFDVVKNGIKLDSFSVKIGSSIKNKVYEVDKHKATPELLADLKYANSVRRAGGGFSYRKHSKEQKSFIVPASWFQSLNPLFIMLLAPLFSFLWVKLGPRNPNGPVKFALGLILLGLGFLVIMLGSQTIVKGQISANISMWWLTLTYLVHTMGELCLSPVGLSYVNKLSPKHLVGLMFGVWFLASALGNKISGSIAGMIEKIAEEKSMSDFFQIFVISTIAAGVLMLVFSPLLKKWMNGVK